MHNFSRTKLNILRFLRLYRYCPALEPLESLQISAHLASLFSNWSVLPAHCCSENHPLRWMCISFSIVCHWSINAVISAYRITGTSVRVLVACAHDGSISGRHTVRLRADSCKLPRAVSRKSHTRGKKSLSHWCRGDE